MAENTGKQIILPLLVAAALALGWLLGTFNSSQLSNNKTQSDKLIEVDRKSTRLNSSHIPLSRMPSSA